MRSGAARSFRSATSHPLPPPTRTFQLTVYARWICRLGSFTNRLRIGRAEGSLSNAGGRTDRGTSRRNSDVSGVIGVTDLILTVVHRSPPSVGASSHDRNRPKPAARSPAPARSGLQLLRDLGVGHFAELSLTELVDLLTALPVGRRKPCVLRIPVPFSAIGEKWHRNGSEPGGRPSGLRAQITRLRAQ